MEPYQIFNGIKSSIIWCFEQEVNNSGKNLHISAPLLEMLSDINYNFGFVVEEIFKLGHTIKS